MASIAHDAYRMLAAEGPHEAAIGTALITLVEPEAGRERAYNRWYEDDHFYAGAMAIPWTLAGRRWVATKDLQTMRYPHDSPIAQPATAGCYMSTYWISAGRFEERWAWDDAVYERLEKEGRRFTGMKHVYTTFHTYLGGSYRDDAGPRDIHALDYPFAGLVLEILDASEGIDRDKLLEWLRGDYLPARLAGSEAAMSLVFAPIVLAVEEMTYTETTPEVQRRLALLSFTDTDPRQCWEETFAGAGEAVLRSGLGHVQFSAPFIPTLPGTDRYVDELR